MEKKKTAFILGVGRSGVAAASLLLQRGFFVSLADDVKVDQGCVLEKIKSLAGRFFAAHKIAFARPVEFEGVALLVVSPGVSMQHPLVREALSCGVPLTSELELALEGYAGKVVSVTGTNGKSTTVSMVHHALSKAGVPSSLAGNIGIPAAELCCKGQMEACLILEVSSYQLEYFPALKSDVAVFFHFSPDHLERHGSLEAYFICKWNLILHLCETGVALISELVAGYAKRFGLWKDLPEIVVVKDSDIAAESELCLASQQLSHNQVNAYYAGFALELLELRLTRQQVWSLLNDFKHLPHRFEVVYQREGLAVIDDSKATNFDAVAVSLESLDAPTVLCLGGRLKEDARPDFSKQQLRFVRRVCVFGESRDKLERVFTERGLVVEPYPSLASLCDNLLEILENHRPDCLLLSPGGSSFDEFSDYVERGRFFSKRVRSLLE